MCGIYNTNVHYTILLIQYKFLFLYIEDIFYLLNLINLVVVYARTRCTMLTHKLCLRSLFTILPSSAFIGVHAMGRWRPVFRWVYFRCKRHLSYQRLLKLIDTLASRVKLSHAARTAF